MRQLNHPATETLDLPSVLYALSEPFRLEIVCNLAYHGEMPCARLCESLTRSTASHHFKVLRECGVIRQRAEGVNVFNELRAADLQSRFPGLLGAVLESAPLPVGHPEKSSEIIQ